MTQIPLQFVHRFSNGSWHVAGTMQVVDADGNYIRDGATVPMSGTIHPSFQPLVDELNEFVANELHAAIVGERDTLRTQLESLPILQAERDQLASQVESLQAEIDALRNPPAPQAVTPAQIRMWLVTRGITMAQTEQFILAIPDPMHREIARIKWEYGVTVLRNDPLVAQFAAAIGLTAEQTDAAFLEASQL